MSTVAAALFLQFVGVSVDLKMSTDDAPDVATHDGTKVLACIDIIVQFVIAEHYIYAKRFEADDASTVVDGCHLDARGRMAKGYWLDCILS